MSNPTAAMLVIGDEVLSGRTRDANAYLLAQELSRVGIDLREIRVVPDSHEVIVAALRALAPTYTHVFTSGGIGPTHDDITADAVADAFDRPIDLRDDARALLEDTARQRGRELTADQLRMARIPDGARLIDNPVSGAPGFSVDNVHVMAGVPEIFAAMVSGLLPQLQQGRPIATVEVVLQRGEGSIAAPLRALASEFDDLAFGSYPSMADGHPRTALVVKGADSQRVEEAVARLEETFGVDAAEGGVVRVA